MDIFDETKAPLKTIWDDKLSRQMAKLVIVSAIGNASDISVKVAHEITDELDRMLLADTDEGKRQKNPSL